MRFFKLFFLFQHCFVSSLLRAHKGQTGCILGRMKVSKNIMIQTSITVTESGTKTLWFKDIYSDFGRNHVVMDRMQRFQPTIGYEFLSFGVETV